jgi:hypothetical protein
MQHHASGFGTNLCGFHQFNFNDAIAGNIAALGSWLRRVMGFKESYSEESS